MQTVALSFDDAPDPTNTAKVLDDLAAAGLHATFFVNTNNQMSVANDGSAQALLKRIVAENHTLGSHTVDHISLDELSTTRIEYEIGGLETELATLGLPIPKVGPLQSLCLSELGWHMAYMRLDPNLLHLCLKELVPCQKP